MKPPFTTLAYRQKLKTALERIPGVNILDDRIEKRPSFEVSLLSTPENFDAFIDAMKSYVEDIKESESTTHTTPS
jgi:hypothetical protein